MSTPSFSHLPDGLNVASTASAALIPAQPLAPTRPVASAAAPPTFPALTLSTPLTAGQDMVPLAHVTPVAPIAPGSPAVAPAEPAGAESDLLFTVGAAITCLFPASQIALPERGGILAGAAGTDSTREICEMQEQRDRHRIQALLEQAEALGHPFEIIERFPSQSLLKAIEAPDAQERLGSDAPASRQPGYVRIRFANDPHDPPIEAIIPDAALPCSFGLPNLPGLPSLTESHQTRLVQAAPGGSEPLPHTTDALSGTDSTGTDPSGDERDALDEQEAARYRRWWFDVDPLDELPSPMQHDPDH